MVISCHAKANQTKTKVEVPIKIVTSASTIQIKPEHVLSCLVLMKNLPALREAFAFAVTELFADLVTDRAPVEYLLVLLCSGAPLIPTSIT